MRYLDRAKTALLPKPILVMKTQEEMNGIGVEVALWWNDSYHENVLCFTKTSRSGTAARISPASAGR